MIFYVRSTNDPIKNKEIAERIAHYYRTNVADLSDWNKQQNGKSYNYIGFEDGPHVAGPVILYHESVLNGLDKEISEKIFK